MGWYGLMVDLGGRQCVVVGGNEVAERRIKELHEAGAVVEIISSQLVLGLRGMVKRFHLVWHQREYRHGDLKGAWLVIAAAGDSMINDMVQREAKAVGTLVHVVDRPGRGNLQIPACVQRGELRFWISTGGTSPALVRRLRADLLARYGPSYAVWVKLLREARSFLQVHESDSRRRKALLQALVGPEWSAICQRGLRAARVELRSWLLKQRVVVDPCPTAELQDKKR